MERRISFENKQYNGSDQGVLSVKNQQQFQKYLQNFLDKSKDQNKKNKDLSKLIYFLEKDTDGIKDFYQKYTVEIFETKFNYLKNFHKGFLGSFVSSSEEIINELKGIANLITNLSQENLIQFLKQDKENKLIFVLYHSLDFSNRQESRKVGYKILIHILEQFPIENLEQLSKSAYFKFFMVLVDFQRIDQQGQKFWTQFVDYKDKKFKNEQYEWIKQVKEPQGSLKFQDFKYLEQLLEQLLNNKDNVNKIVNWMIIMSQTWFKISFPHNYLQFSHENQKQQKDFQEIVNTGNLLNIQDYQLQPFQKQKIQSIFLKYIKKSLEILNNEFVEKQYLFDYSQFQGVIELLSSTFQQEENISIANEILIVITNFLVNVQFPIKNGSQDKIIKFIIKIIIEGVSKEIKLTNNIGSNLKRLQYFNQAIQNVDSLNSLQYLKEDLFSFSEILLQDLQTKQFQITKQSIQTLVFQCMKKMMQLGEQLIENKYQNDFQSQQDIRCRLQNVSIQFLNNPDMISQFHDYFVEISNKFIDFLYEKDNYKEFQNQIMLNKIYPCKQEHVLQILIRHHALNYNCCQKYLNNFQQKQKKQDRYIEITGLENLKNKENIKNIQHRFSILWHKLLIFIDLNNYTNPTSFNYACNFIHILFDILIEPDRDVKIERGVQTPLPKFSPNTQTFLEIIENIIKKYINYPFRKNYQFMNLNQFESDNEYRDIFKGKLTLLKTLSKIFTITDSEIPNSLAIIHDSIGIIHQLLTEVRQNPNSSEKNIIAQVLIQYTSEIFCTDKPGIKMLIPQYIWYINKILTVDSTQILSSANQKHIEKQLKVVSSILDKPDYYEFENQKKQSVFSVIKNSAVQLLKQLYFLTKNYWSLKIITFNKESEVYCKDLNSQVIDISTALADLILSNLKDPQYETNSKIQIDFKLKYNIFGLYYLLIIDRDLPLEHFKCIWNFALFCIDYNNNNQKDFEMAKIAIQFVDSVSSLSTNLQLDQQIIKKSLLTIIDILKKTQKNQKNLPVMLLNALLNWILNFKVFSFSDSSKIIKLIIQAFKNLEKIDNELKIQVDITYKQIQKNYNNFPAKLQNDDNIRPSIFTDETFHFKTQIKDALEKGDIEQISKYSKIPLKQIQDAFQNQKKEDYFDIFNHLVGTIGQQSLEKDYNKQITLAQNDQKIYSFIQQEENDSFQLKVILRDSTGKTSWIFKYYQIIQDTFCKKKPQEHQQSQHQIMHNFFNFQEFSDKYHNPHNPNLATKDIVFNNLLQQNLVRNESNFSSNPMTSIESESKESEENEDSTENQEKQSENNNNSSNQKNEKTYKISNFNNKQEDKQEQNKLDEILDEINNDNDKLKPYKCNLTEGEIIAYKQSKEQSKIKNEEIQLIITRNNRKRESYHQQISEYDEQEYLNKTQFKIWDGVRLFMSQLHMLTEDNCNWVLLNQQSQEYINLLNLLDKTNLREQVKVGVLYLKKDQSTQKEILQNQQGSPIYQYFIKYLGRQIELNKHLGFMGGLKAGLDGQNAVYYSDCLKEIIFHTATMMPNPKDDEQCISKKRHVGNDHVNIVWCENVHKYRHYTISSQFNFSHLVIYPLNNNLFRLCYQNKSNVSLFFPWLDNSIVSLQVLVDVIRLSAVQAHRQSRLTMQQSQTDKMIKPFQYRQNLINDIINKCGKPISQTEFNTLLFTGSNYKKWV